MFLLLYFILSDMPEVVQIEWLIPRGKAYLIISAQKICVLEYQHSPQPLKLKLGRPTYPFLQLHRQMLYIPPDKSLCARHFFRFLKIKGCVYV